VIRGLGAKRDTKRAQPDARGHLAAARVRAGEPLPANFDLTQYEPDRLDQGHTGSCEGHGWAAGTYTGLAANGTPLGYVPSPRYGYAGARSLERGAALTPGVATSIPLPAFVDNGTETEVMAQWYAQGGTIPMLGPTPDGRNSDIWSAADLSGIPNAPAENVNNELSLGGLVSGAKRLVTGTHRIVDPTAADTLLQVQTCLYTLKSPVIVGTFVDSAFEQWQAGQAPIPAPNTNDASGGGHCLYISGFATVNGVVRILVTNSWGKGWADQGRCWCSVEWVQACWDLLIGQSAISAVQEAA
jgi:hypothetical protein